LHACLAHPDTEKFTEIIHADFLDYSGLENRMKGHDACYWCLGVSQMKVRKEDDYHRFTHDFTIEAAKVMEKLNPGMTFCFLSGMGTDETQKSK
jgi:hypothetical protein